MFERYTPKARRAVFFARYEARQCGSPYIETEHLLFGLLRGDQALTRMLLGQATIQAEIRAEIEQQITRKEPIPISVEISLTGECSKALVLAAEECERLGHLCVEPGHILLGLLRVEGSLAARVLQARGVTAATLREELVRGYGAPPDEKAKLKLDSFLAGLKWDKAEQLIEYFAEKAQFTDVFGKRWNREEIFKGFETLFAPYAKKNATPLVEDTLVDEDSVFVACVLWKNAILASLQRIWIHRMSVVLVREGEDWRILLMHVTPVQPL